MEMNAEDIVRMIAGFTMDGQDRADQDGEPFEMLIDDAYDTVHSCISVAREWVADNPKKVEEGVRT